VTLLQGDCLEVLPTLADGSVDMVFADLPYGVTACHWDSKIDLGQLWPELLRVGKRNAAFVFTATQPFATTLICSQRRLFRYELVWEKPKPVGFMNAGKRPLAAHEGLYVFAQPRHIYNNQTIEGEPYKARRGRGKLGSIYSGEGGQAKDNPGRRHPRSVLQFPAINERRRMHPTQKPVALLEWLVRTYCNPGDTVLDPTAGSGTAAIAALRTGRKYICIEKDPTYFDTMKRRVTEAQAQAALPGLAPWEQHGRDTAASSAAASG
jgi:DNA modification methylase